jgi:hypothetical protein
MLLELEYSDGSPYARAVRVPLHELALEYVGYHANQH